jgi:hypothetical protein
MSDDHDDAGYPDSGYDGWMGDDQPRPPGRGGRGKGRGGRGGEGGRKGGGGEGGSPESGPGPEKGPDDEPLRPGDHDVTIQAMATSDRQTVLVVNHQGALVQTDRANLISLRARELLVARLKDALVLDDAQAERLLKRVTRRWLEFFKLQQERLNAGPSRKDAAQLLEETPKEVLELAEAMLRDEHLVQQVIDDVHALGVAGENAIVAVLYLTGVSRLLPRPLSSRVHGPSASGKSFLIEATASLFPAETVLAATSMTPQALYHSGQDELRNRWVIGGERSRVENDEKADGTKALREMQAAGRLSKYMPIKVNGEITSVLIEREGPIAFTESTTRNKIFDEDANRCVALHTDESKEQTERIIKAIAARAAGNGGDTPAQAVREKHWAVQRLLSPCEVVVPYAEALGRLLHAEQVEWRRGISQVISCVRALALLHQFQRERDSQGRLAATPLDYHLARGLLDGPLARLVGLGVSRPAANLFKRIRDNFDAASFTTAEAKRVAPGARSSVHGWLRELHEAELIDELLHGKGNQPSTWQVRPSAEAPTDNGPAVLPSTDKLMDEYRRAGGTP